MNAIREQICIHVKNSITNKQFNEELSFPIPQETGSSLINLEFYKRYDNNTIKLVKLKIHTEKRLELKTIFIKEEQ